MFSKLITSNTVAVFFLILLLIGSILLLRYAFRPTMDAVDWHEEIHQVRAGESLWAISGKYCPENVDRREWIAAVQELNGMDDSIIYPNQKLTVLTPNK